MKILGIDTALASLGWAILDGQKLEDYGVIKTEAGTPTGDRLQVIRQDLTELLNLYKPEKVAIEKPFSFRERTKNESLVHQALGVILMTCSDFEALRPSKC